MNTKVMLLISVVLLSISSYIIYDVIHSKSERKEVVMVKYLQDRLPAAATLQKALLMGNESMIDYYSKGKLTDEEYLKKLSYDKVDLDKAILSAKSIKNDDPKIKAINDDFVATLEKYRDYVKKRIDYFPDMTREKSDALDDSRTLSSEVKSFSDELSYILGTVSQFRKETKEEERAVMEEYSSSVTKDSDDDGLDDLNEKVFKTDPGKSDSDNNGKSDGKEVRESGTNPTGDGYLWEVYKL